MRAIKILNEVDLIAAEDTRHTLKLLNHLQIHKPLISYYKQNERIKTEILIEKILNGKNIAIVTDAGTPIISDPGEEIVKEAIKKEIEVIPIPGACATINALIASGISAKEFCFIGFLPVLKKEKMEKLSKIKNISQTIILYEAPHKLIKTLKEMKEILGDRQICLAKEITKIHETFFRGKISEIMEKVIEPKGEFVIVIEGKTDEDNEIKEFFNNLSLEELYKFYKNKGLNKKEIIKQIAKDKNLNKNEIYQGIIKIEKNNK